MVYEFINFLFPLLSHISLIFSFSNSVFTASISTLPYSFFFPLPFWSVLFPFVNMSHHRFPLYHHWSLSPVFFFPLLFALSFLFYLRVAYRRGSLFYLEPPIRCSLFLESLIHRSISEGFIDLFYIYCVQVSSPSSLWFSNGLFGSLEREESRGE